MKAKLVIIFILSIFHQLDSQIKVESKIDYESKKAYIVLINESNSNVAIPLDRSSLRPYFNNICLDLSEYGYNYPTLGLNIKVEQNGNIVESSATSGIPYNLNDLEKESKIFKLEKKEFEKKVKLWQKKNKLKSFEEAKINYYIFNSLIFLKPKEKISLVYHFNLGNITNEKYISYYYHIEKNQKYDVSFYFNITECVYKYFTESQKKKLNNYNLFTGEIESNKRELR